MNEDREMGTDADGVALAAAVDRLRAARAVALDGALPALPALSAPFAVPAPPALLASPPSTGGSELADDLRERLADRREATAAARHAASAYAAMHGHVPGGADDELVSPGGARWALRPRAAIVAVCAVLVLAVAAAVATSWPRGQVDELTALDGPVVERAPAPGSVPAQAPAPEPEPSASPSALLVVDVVGQVHHPGLVTLPAGSRVFDAVAAAGGATEGAELSAINLARPVVDGEQLRVPAPGEVVAAPVAPDGVPATGRSDDGRVNLNTADEATLETLPGIGPALAARIVAWRTDNGPFASVDELDEVSGIGPAMLAKVRDLVTV
ncbi:ComEA family DNA-binding protein [Xylanimonas cellulosilytica]|nr:ComEA family DNA-binding protein [Xylanimonas cellulosilytica]